MAFFVCLHSSQAYVSFSGANTGGSWNSDLTCRAWEQVKWNNHIVLLARYDAFIGDHYDKVTYVVPTITVKGFSAIFIPSTTILPLPLESVMPEAREPPLPPLPKDDKDQANNNNKKKKGKRLPNPQELVSHYEKQGLGTQEASFKVIQDLQGALFRAIAISRSRKPADATSAKLDTIHSRLLQLEMKVDSKPSYPQNLILGVASAGIWNTALQLWNTIRQTASSSDSA